MFKIDINEPVNILMPLMAPVINNLSIDSLNSQGMADYFWRRIDGTYKMVERKTWPELLSNPDKVEEQLQRHLDKYPEVELVFMLEGMVQQNEMGTHILQQTNSGIFVKGHRYSARLKRIYSWLYEISNYCQVVQTTSLYESATALVAMYDHDQKDNHTTLKRHIKQVEFTSDPRITTLMGASSGLGNKRATQLINYGGTPYNVWTAGYCEHSAIKDKYAFTNIEGIGRGILDSMYRGIGRPDS